MTYNHLLSIDPNVLAGTSVGIYVFPKGVVDVFNACKRKTALTKLDVNSWEFTARLWCHV